MCCKLCVNVQYFTSEQLHITGFHTFISIHFILIIVLFMYVLYMLYYALCLYNRSTCKEYLQKKNTNFNWTTQILPEAEAELQTSLSQFGQSPDRFHGWHFSMRHPHATQQRVQIVSDVTVRRGRQRRAQTRTLARTIVEAVCISIWLRETIMHCHQYITYKPFLSCFLLFPTCCVTAWGQ